MFIVLTVSNMYKYQRRIKSPDFYLRFKKMTTLNKKVKRRMKTEKVKKAKLNERKGKMGVMLEIAELIRMILLRDK